MRFSPALPAAAAVALLFACSDEGPSNTPPTAEFTAECNELTCRFTDASSDADGAIEAYVWDLGDGATAEERDLIHTYAAPGGQFAVKLRITDDSGAEATAERQVTVSLENRLPVAAFAVSCTDLTCSFTDQSTDEEPGSVISWSWGFGDGGVSSERNPTHTYAYPGGRFSVLLAVRDDAGAYVTAIKEVEVNPGAAQD